MTSSRCHLINERNAKAGISILAMETDLCCPPIISKMLPKSHNLEKCDVLKPIIHTQMFVLEVLRLQNFARDQISLDDDTT